jgi:hypothetical protein
VYARILLACLESSPIDRAHMHSFGNGKWFDRTELNRIMKSVDKFGVELTPAL